MNKIDRRLEKIKLENRLGLMTHVVCGYPTLKESEEIVELMDKSGVDFIKMQIQFSDPLADGPTIMRACEMALEKGAKVKDAFEMAEELAQKVSAPLLFMAYYNNIFKFGVEKFIKKAKEVGISGLIVPDMPIEEEDEEHFIKFCDKYGIYHIHVLSPVSTEERIKKNSEVASGFLYCTARQGITGAKSELDPKVGEFLKRVKKYVKVPLAVGFGISKKEHMEVLKGNVEIAVVGSVILDIINQNKGYLKKIEKFLKGLRT